MEGAKDPDEYIIKYGNARFQALIDKALSVIEFKVKLLKQDLDLDSTNDKIKFLNELVDKLGLKGITAVHGRAEDAARKKEYREQFDLCVSRAVANLSSLLEYCLPFVKKDGLFISYKSTNIDTEITDAKKALFLLGGKMEDKKTFYLPDSDIGRTLLVINKEKTTPSKYPRKAGLPSKEPL